MDRVGLYPRYLHNPKTNRTECGLFTYSFFKGIVKSTLPFKCKCLVEGLKLSVYVSSLEATLTQHIGYLYTTPPSTFPSILPLNSQIYITLCTFFNLSVCLSHSLCQLVGWSVSRSTKMQCYADVGTSAINQPTTQESRFSQI